MILVIMPLALFLAKKRNVSPLSSIMQVELQMVIKWTSNGDQMNYTTTEKELLVVIFTLDKYRSYLISLSTIVYSDHADVRYLMSK